MRSTTGVYIVGLDHVRAMAALMVFMWHFSHPPFGLTPFGYVPRFFALSIFNEGHTGVALFMTLSGFIFSMLSFEKEIELVQFYKNRFFRVFPLLFFWCIFGIALQGDSAADIARTMFTLLGNNVPAGGWTVIVEAQFYLLFPFIHPTIERNYKQKGIAGVGLYILAFLCFTWILRWGTLMETGSAQTISYWTIFGRLDQFILGAFFFYMYESVVRNMRRIKAVLIFISSILTFLLFWYWFNKMGGWRFYDGYPSAARIWIAMPTIEGGFYGLFIAFYLRISQNFRGRVARSFAYIGTISYSIYLSNFFVIPLLENFHSKIPFTNTNGFGEYFIWGVVIGFPLICVFSSMTYWFIERPFLDRRKRYIRSHNFSA